MISSVLFYGTTEYVRKSCVCYQLLNLLLYIFVVKVRKMNIIQGVTTYVRGRSEVNSEILTGGVMD